MRKKTYLIFDVDGTIYNSGAIIIDAFSGALDRFSRVTGKTMHVPGKESMLAFLGVPLKDIFKVAYPLLGEAERSTLVELFTEELVTLIRSHKGKTYEHVQSTFASLRNAGYEILIASNAEPHYVDAILDTYDLRKYLSGPIAHLSDRIRNKSDLLRHYKETIVKDDYMTMIGDRFTDKKAALDNDVPFIGCVFGYGVPAEFSDCSFLIHRFDQIHEILPVLAQRCDWQPPVAPACTSRENTI